MNCGGETWALLPVKGLGKVKQRLEPVLSAPDRERLFLALLEDLFTAVAAADALDGVLVVGGEASLAALVEGYGLDFVAEPGEVSGLNGAVAWGLSRLGDSGAARALVLHGDLPLATPEAVDSVLDHAASDNVVLVPDWREDGTNGLVTPLPIAFPLGYGPGSYNKHIKSVATAGLDQVSVGESRLAFDVDTPQDLAFLCELAAIGLCGVRTTRLVASLDPGGLPAVNAAEWHALVEALGVKELA